MNKWISLPRYRYIRRHSKSADTNYTYSYFIINFELSVGYNISIEYGRYVAQYQQFQALISRGFFSTRQIVVPPNQLEKIENRYQVLTSAF